MIVNIGIIIIYIIIISSSSIATILILSDGIPVGAIPFIAYIFVKM